MRVSIKIKNPVAVALYYGEQAGDFTPDECVWWVGTVHALYPASIPLSGAKIINAPVKFCGGSAWVQHTRRSRPSSLPLRDWVVLHCSGWSIRTLPRVLRGEITGKICPTFNGPRGVLP